MRRSKRGGRFFEREVEDPRSDSQHERPPLVVCLEHAVLGPREVLEVAQEPRVIATGRYDKSVVVRTEAGWRFQSRTLTVDPGFFILAKQWEQAGHAG